MFQFYHLLLPNLNLRRWILWRFRTSVDLDLQFIRQKNFDIIRRLIFCCLRLSSTNSLLSGSTPPKSHFHGCALWKVHSNRAIPPKSSFWKYLVIIIVSVFSVLIKPLSTKFGIDGFIINFKHPVFILSIVRSMKLSRLLALNLLLLITLLLGEIILTRKQHNASYLQNSCPKLTLQFHNSFSSLVNGFHHFSKHIYFFHQLYVIVEVLL